MWEELVSSLADSFDRFRFVCKPESPWQRTRAVCTHPCTSSSSIRVQARTYAYASNIWKQIAAWCTRMCSRVIRASNYPATLHYRRQHARVQVQRPSKAKAGTSPPVSLWLPLLFRRIGMSASECLTPPYLVRLVLYYIPVVLIARTSWWSSFFCNNPKNPN